jgi:hypothetical protein
MIAWFNIVGAAYVLCPEYLFWLGRTLSRANEWASQWPASIMSVCVSSCFLVTLHHYQNGRLQDAEVELSKGDRTCRLGRWSSIKSRASIPKLGVAYSEYVLRSQECLRPCDDEAKPSHPTSSTVVSIDHYLFFLHKTASHLSLLTENSFL